MAKVSKLTLQKHLEQLEAEELREELMTLYQKFPNVKEYYQAELETGDESQVLESYKKKIYQAYFPKRGAGRRKNSTCRKLISAYRKIAVFEVDVIDLCLWRVECAVMAFHDRNEKRYEAYFTAFWGTYELACRLIAKQGEWETFKDRLAALDRDAADLPYDTVQQFEKYRAQFQE